MPYLRFALIVLLFVVVKNNDCNAGFPKDPIATFMGSIGTKEYSKLIESFSPELITLWKQTLISSDIKDIRETLGETWEPKETNSMNWQTPQGIVIQKTFRLQKKYNSNYSFSFTTKEIQDEFKIILLNATVPYHGSIPDKALSICKAYIHEIQTKQYKEARNMVFPPYREKITDVIYQTVRNLLVTESGEPAELSIEGHRALINGVWYDTMVVTPKNGNFLQHFTVYLSLAKGSYSIVTIEFRNPQIIN